MDQPDEKDTTVPDLESAPAGPAAEESPEETMSRRLHFFEERDEKDLEKYRAEVAKGSYLPTLMQAAAAYLEPEEFSPRDVVRWKPLLKSDQYPDYGAPAVFIRYLTSEEQAANGGVSLFRPMARGTDCKIAYLDKDLDLVTIHVNSARLTKQE